MKVLTEKLDYQLYEEMFVNKDLSKVRELWKAICENPVFLREAMEIDKIANSSVLSFRAPMICFMMLRLPASVPEYFYSNLVDLVIRRQDVASSIDIHGTYIDFLSLVLGNCNLKLEDYQKDKIMDPHNTDPHAPTITLCLLHDKSVNVFYDTAIPLVCNSNRNHILTSWSFMF